MPSGFARALRSRRPRVAKTRAPAGTSPRGLKVVYCLVLLVRNRPRRRSSSGAGERTVWSMSALSALAILSAHFEMAVTFFLRFDLAETFFCSFGRIEFFAHTKTASRENTDARSAGERTEVSFLFGSACSSIVSDNDILRLLLLCTRQAARHSGAPPPLQSPRTPPSPCPNGIRVTSTQKNGPSRVGRGANCIPGTHGSGRRAFRSPQSYQAPKQPAIRPRSQSSHKTGPKLVMRRRGHQTCLSFLSLSPPHHPPLLPTPHAPHPSKTHE